MSDRKAALIAEVLSDAIDELLDKQNDNDIVFDAIAMTLRGMDDRVGPITRDKLHDIADNISDLMSS